MRVACPRMIEVGREKNGHVGYILEVEIAWLAERLDEGED